MSTRKEWTFGAHQARWEEPDVLMCTFRGPTGLEDARNVIDLCRELAAEQPIFVVSDISQGTIDKEARDYFSQHIRSDWFQGLVYVGTDAFKRAAAKAIVIALYFTGKCKVAIEFAETQEAARGIVSRLRGARQAKGAPHSRGKPSSRDSAAAP